MSFFWKTDTQCTAGSSPTDREEINLRTRWPGHNEQTNPNIGTESSSSTTRLRKQPRPVSTKSIERLNSVIMVDPIFEYQFRVILIGDSTVGKSSLLRRFTDETFAEVSDPTVGVDFFAKLVKVSDDTTIKLQLWDTAGQERFRSITKSYYRNSVGVLVVYDICNRESFLHIPVWMSEAKRHIEPHKAVFILVGCKHDIAKKDSTRTVREVSEDEAKDFAKHNHIDFFETSARTGMNVDLAFSSLSQTIYDKILKGDYRIQDGWDGIKKGYFGGNRYQYGGATSSNNPNNRAISHLSSNGSRLLVAEPASDRILPLCCYNC